MIRRSTAIVLIVFLILVIAAWYLRRNNKTSSVEETVTPTAVTRLYDLTVDSVANIQIEKTGGGRLIMEKDQQGIWSFVEPAGYEIIQDEAQSIAEKILALNVLAALEKPPSLDVLGLDKPGYRIIITSNDGSDLIAIIGNLTSTSSGYYASRMGQIPVIVSKISLDEIFEKIDSPPIFVTQTPSATPLNTETQTPQTTPTP
jgi:hypothetical protein